MATALYPGSFDPPTMGHLDVIRRARRLFDRLVVAIGTNPAKRSLFTVPERQAFLRRVLDDAKVEAEVATFEGLAVERAPLRRGPAPLRGIRGAGDFSTTRWRHEPPPLAGTGPSSDAVPSYSFVSANLVREAGRSARVSRAGTGGIRTT
jgi:cytidyltransferase-like protein